MSSPKVIVFDLGKVLVDFDYSIAARRIAARCTRPADSDHFFSDHGNLLCQYELGEVTTEEFSRRICDAAGYSGTLEEFGESFADIFTEIPEMTALQARLRKKGYPTYIFSNTNLLAIRHITSRFPFLRNFDGYIYSYEHGSMKPDSKLYDVVERVTGCSAGEIVYIDDREENVAAGSLRGWNAILHETPQKTRMALDQLGLLCTG
jgi:FMN phosphatase YigB (HAD superfamily)